MFKSLKASAMTDFEMRNPEALREYHRRENKKWAIKTAMFYGTMVAVAVAGTIASVKISEKSHNAGNY